MSTKSISGALDNTIDAFGAIHIGVNTAGGGVARRTLSREGAHPIEDFRKVIELNLVGSFDFLSQAAERMAKNKPNEDGERGVIVSTASIAANRSGCLRIGKGRHHWHDLCRCTRSWRPRDSLYGHRAKPVPNGSYGAGTT